LAIVRVVEPQFVTNNSINGKQLHTALSARLVELEAAAPNFQRNRPLTGYKLFDLVTESQIAALATAAPPTTPPHSSSATTPPSSSNAIPPTTLQGDADEENN
jgi:hypothetical protein